MTPVRFLLRGVALPVAVVLSLGLAAHAAQTPPVASAAPSAGKVDPQARALLDKMVAAYPALTRLAGTVELVSKRGDAPATTVQTVFAFAGPNKARVTVTEGTNTTTAISDGANLFTVSSRDPKTFQKQPAPAGKKALTQALFVSGGEGVGLFPILLTDPDAAKKLLPPGVLSLERSADDVVGGVAVNVVVAVFKQGVVTPKLTFAVDKEDNLLRRLSAVMTGPDNKEISFTETYTGIMTDSAPDAAVAFTFTPPPGATLAEAPKEPKEPARYDPRLKPGAKPLPFAGTDLTGKPVSLNQYKGKVVLIDFWATWCGPCVAELPNVVAAYNKYKNKGFDIIGVSLDRAGDRQKLVAFAKSHAMPWRQIYDGKHWQSAQAKRYGVQAIPFTLLIGRDGKIAAVGARGEELEPTIKAALAKK